MIGRLEWTNQQKVSGAFQMLTVPGNRHIPSQATFEDDVVFPKLGYVSSLEGKWGFFKKIDEHFSISNHGRSKVGPYQL